jgi:hypothetical protein
MTTKPKTRKAPAAKPAQEEAPRSHRAVVLTVDQRDELNEILKLVQAISLAILGSELDEFEQTVICTLVRAVDNRVTAFIGECNAYAAGTT